MKGKIRRARLCLAAALAGSTFGTAASFAGFTHIAPPPGTEAGQMQILQHTYGGSWHGVDGDFYCGTISAKRLDDWMSVCGTSQLSDGECGNAADQMWCGDRFEVRAVAKFSQNSQSFGCVEDGGGSYPLMSVTGYGFDISNSSATADMHGHNFKWQRSGESGTQTSCDTDNLDGRDHLATYVIAGLPNQDGPVFMLFWEDLDKTPELGKHRSFADFNDLAVEIRPLRSGGNPQAVPLPPALPAGLITLGGAALARFGKRLKRVSA